MVSLILVVISIALLSAIVMTAVPHISMEALERQTIQKEVDHGVHLLEAGVVRYLDANRDVAGESIYPGDNVTLTGTLTPQYGFVPADVRAQMTWRVQTGYLQGQPAVGICVYPITSTSAAQQASLLNVQRKLPKGSAFVAGGCNATNNSVEGTSLTYWVVLSHLN